MTLTSPLLLTPARIGCTLPQVFADVLSAGDGGAGPDRDVAVRHRDGRECPVSMSVRHIPGSLPAHRLVHLHDTTLRRRAESAYVWDDVIDGYAALCEGLTGPR